VLSGKNDLLHPDAVEAMGLPFVRQPEKLRCRVPPGYMPSGSHDDLIIKRLVGFWLLRRIVGNFYLAQS
jgi:hypothetical protein